MDLLTNTGLAVGDIAARSGFKSVYHFSRRIKEHTRAPPTQIRRERWRDTSLESPRSSPAWLAER